MRMLCIKLEKNNKHLPENPISMTHNEPSSKIATASEIYSAVNFGYIQVTNTNAHEVLLQKGEKVASLEVLTKIDIVNTAQKNMHTIDDYMQCYKGRLVEKENLRKMIIEMLAENMNSEETKKMHEINLIEDANTQQQRQYRTSLTKDMKLTDRSVS